MSAKPATESATECFHFKEHVDEFKHNWQELNRKIRYFDLDYTECPIYKFIDKNWGKKSAKYFAEFTKQGHEITLEYGIWSAEDLNEVNGPTLLTYACRYKKSDIALAIIEHVDTSWDDMYGCTALIYACKNKMVDVALAIIKKGSCNMNKYSLGMSGSAFTRACCNMMIPVIEAMLSSEELDLNTIDEGEGEIYASYLFADHLTHYATEMFNKNKIDLTKINTEGYTLLHSAISYKLIEIALAIIATGRIDLKNALLGQTYLEFAKMHSVPAIVDAINSALASS